MKWISDTRSHGSTDLQSLVKCLDHRGPVSVLNAVYSQARVVLEDMLPGSADQCILESVSLQLELSRNT